MVPVEVVLPCPNTEDESGDGDGKKKSALATTREEIFSQVEKGARLDLNFLLLVFLSTIVAAIGLIEDNVGSLLAPWSSRPCWVQTLPLPWRPAPRRKTPQMVGDPQGPSIVVYLFDILGSVISSPDCHYLSAT